MCVKADGDSRKKKGRLVFMETKRIGRFDIAAAGGERIAGILTETDRME